MRINISVKSLFKKHHNKQSASTFGIPWRYLLLTIMTILLIAFLGTLKFIYSNLTNSFRSAQDIIILRSKVVPEIYDVQKFQEVIESLQNKQNPAPIDWQSVKNPFRANEERSPASGPPSNTLEPR